MQSKERHAEWARAYRRTLKGFLETKYTAMQKRIQGKDKNCLRTVQGLPIVSRELFYDWAAQQTQLYSMFWSYECSGWDFKLCPTIDRINPRRGYELDNMRFVTQSENAKGSTWNRPVKTPLTREEINRRAREYYKIRKEKLVC
jgi:hypothetical protein